jgi:peroxiredoxin
MKAKYIISFVVVLYLIFFGNCKRKTLTGPNGDEVIELSGVITLDAQPFSNVEVNLSGDSSKKTLTGPDGKFSFANLLSGSYVITPSKQGYTFSPSSYEVGSQTRYDLNFVAQLVKSGSKVGELAVDFTAKDQNNNDISLSDYSGKVVLFDFSADWCGPCRDEAKHLEALYNEYKDRGFQVITLLISGSPSAWANEYNLTFPVLNDNDETIWDVYGEGYVPLNIVVDRDRIIRYKKAGYNETEIRAIIEDYL